MHILDENQLSELETITQLLQYISLRGTTIIAAESNLSFIRSYPALLPFVIVAPPTPERSASLNTVHLLNILI